MPNYKNPSPDYYAQCNQYVNNRYSTDPLYFTSLEFVEFNLLIFLGTEVQEKAVDKLIKNLIGSIEQKIKIGQVLKQYGLKYG